MPADRAAEHKSFAMGESPPTLLLIDALGAAYRAFHAIPPLTARDGTPTNAVLGFVKAVRHLLERYKPSHCAAVFDGGLPVERLQRLPGYKANRPPMPDALRSQLSLVEKYLEAEGIVHLRIDAQEADDVIASLAVRAAEDGAEVKIASTDKDLYQIVSERIKLVPPVKDSREIGPSEVAQKTGVPPSLIADWLALVGDSVDNIPGIPGIGEKTAAKLLAEYGSLEGLLARIDEIPNERVRGALRGAVADVLRNRELVRLNCQVPAVPPLDALRRRPANEPMLRLLFERLNMASLAPAPTPGQMELF